MQCEGARLHGHSHAENRHKSWYYGKQECRRITNVFWCNYHWYKTNIFLLFLLQVSSTGLGPWNSCAAGKRPSWISSLKATGSRELKVFSLHRSLIRHAFRCFQPKQFKQSFLRGEKDLRGGASFCSFANIASYFALSRWGRLHICKNSIG